MKQYCRYCAYCCYGDVVYCDIKKQTMSERKAKQVNKCKSFVLNEIDVFNPEHLYKPQDKRKASNQISLFEGVENV